jgi:type IV pilus assembly protein PilA
MANKNLNFGFTLIELMVVVAVIGILSSVAVPAFKKYQAKSRITQAKMILTSVFTAEKNAFSESSTYVGCVGIFGAENFSSSVCGAPAGLWPSYHYGIWIDDAGGSAANTLVRNAGGPPPSRFRPKALFVAGSVC